MDNNNPIDRCIIDARKGKKEALEKGDALKYLGESAREYICKQAKKNKKN